jgi:hypothetical protein
MDGPLHAGQRFLMGFAVSRAAGKHWNFRAERLIFVASANNERELRHPFLRRVERATVQQV